MARGKKADAPPTEIAGFPVHVLGTPIPTSVRRVKWKGHSLLVPHLDPSLSEYEWVCHDVLRKPSIWASTNPAHFQGQGVIGVHHISSECDVVSPAPSDRMCFKCVDGFLSTHKLLKYPRFGS